MTKFKFVELFAGIGGVSFGFERVGGECVLAAEFDPTAKKVQFTQLAYATLHPNTPLTGDVTKLDEKNIPDHDVLSFTTPCQSFSVAGKRLGFEDTRGTLVFEALRIAKYKRPKVLFMENVKGLVSHDKGRTLDTLVKAMSDIGYRVDFDILNSKYFGVPQNRERIFIVAIREDLVQNEPWTNVSGSTIIPKGKRRISEIEGVKTFNFAYPEHAEVTTRLRDILEDSVDERYYLSEEKTAKLVAQLEGKDEEPRLVGGIGEINFGKQYRQGNRIYDAEAEEVRPVLTPDRMEKRQNGRRFKENDEEAFTLTAQDKHGVALGNPPKYRIRKLTPLECFRLQGFSDEAHQALVDAGISNSQLYKMAGNAVTVNVIEAIGERLLPYLTKEDEA